jgi:hypothetical protein
MPTAKRDPGFNKTFTIKRISFGLKSEYQKYGLEILLIAYEYINPVCNVDNLPGKV